MLNSTFLKTLLKRHEGVRARAYPDSLGILTVGVGRNLEETDFSPDEIERMLNNDIVKAAKSARACLSVFDDLSDTRQMVLVDMAFNLGQTRLMKFAKFLNALQMGDYDEAADQMLASKWATQVGARAQTLAAMMRSNTLPDWVRKD